MKKIFNIIILISFLLVGCSSKTVKKEPIPQEAPKVVKEIKGPPFSGSDIYEFYEKGKSTWYGKKFHGKSTSSGEKFNMNNFTAAHKHLPFGTMVEVTNIMTGEKVIVKINDRGPYGKGKVIDLSYAAFSSIADISEGIISVEVRIVSYPK